MDFTAQQDLGDGVVERSFSLDEAHGLLWTPADASRPTPLILLGHPGGLPSTYPRLLARARSAVQHGHAAATLELPGAGERPPSRAADTTRAELRRVLSAGEPVLADLVDRLVLPLVEAAVPEWRTLLDACLTLPEVAGGVAYSGGIIALGTRLAAVEPRIDAAVLFAGSFVPRATLVEAAGVTIPLLMLLQWDDEANDRQMALGLFDAFGSREKTLHANLGGHTGVPAFEGQDAARFFVRHLGRQDSSGARSA